MNQFDYSYLQLLNDKQREICLSPDNYVLTACPGSGKTRTITYRLAYLHQVNFPSQLLNIAITYTNRAANEILSRLEKMDIDASTVWTGTIHQFCMKYIIRPYAMYSDRLRAGYHIIDEYVIEQYGKEIAEMLDIQLGRYDDPLLNPKIKAEYDKRLQENKEIDFDLILKISDELLINCPFIAENISSIVRSIHIDEFQDTNELQYSILSRIVQKNKRINVLFVGDVNQAIYGSLGGIAKSTESLRLQFGIDFKEDVLSGCYRSTQRIIDFYSNFELFQTRAISVSPQKNAHGFVAYDCIIHLDNLYGKISTIISNCLSAGVEPKDICVAAPQWGQIFSIANHLREALPNVNFDAPNIAPFKYDPLNPFYLLSRLLFTPTGRNVIIRKRVASETIEILESEYGITVPHNFDIYSLLKAINSAPKTLSDGLIFFDCAVHHIFRSMGISISDEDKLQNTYLAFVERAKQRILRNNIPSSYDDFCKCYKERDGIVINTIHGIKGEEYEIVIAFGLLTGYLPNWEYIINPIKQNVRREETLKLLYVLCSRAKKELYLFSENGRKTSKGSSYNPTDELRSVNFDFDIG